MRVRGGRDDIYGDAAASLILIGGAHSRLIFVAAFVIYTAHTLCAIVTVNVPVSL